MVLIKETDPIMLALQKEVKLKQSMIDQLTEENNHQTMLIDQLRQDSKALTLEYERRRKKQNERLSEELLKECESEQRINPQAVKAVMLEIEQLRESNAVLLAAMREERGAGGDHSSTGKRRLYREHALIFQRKALEDSYNVLQRQMSRDTIKRGMEYAFKHSICLVKSEGGMDSEGDLDNDHPGSGGVGGDIQSLVDVSEVDSCTPQRQTLVAKRVMGGVKVKEALKQTAQQEVKQYDRAKEEIKEVPQKKDAREELRIKVALALVKEKVIEDTLGEVDFCPPPQHQVTGQLMTSVKETTNLEVKVGSKEVAKDGLELGTQKPVPLAHEPVIYHISDCILRKKCFDDEEIVDEVDEDIEKLIMETYSKKVTFDEDVEEIETIEEELEDEHEDRDLGAEERDMARMGPNRPEEEEEEEEFLSSDDEDLVKEEKEEVTIVGEIGQFRKKTFDDEELIDEVDSEVEMLIMRTYATFVSFDEDE